MNAHNCPPGTLLLASSPCPEGIMAPPPDRMVFSAAHIEEIKRLLAAWPNASTCPTESGVYLMHMAPRWNEFLLKKVSPRRPKPRLAPGMTTRQRRACK